MNLPGLCKDCPKRCCSGIGPLMTTDEYIKMTQAAGEEKVLAKAPKYNGSRWHFTILSDCPALSDAGCIMEYKDRPLACRLAPFILVPLYNGDKNNITVDLLLTLTCLKWREFGEYYAEIIKEVKEYIK